MVACDKECALAAWSGWSTCSRACGGGFEERSRKVLEPASGLGKCDAEDSEYRLQYRRCNLDECKPKTAPYLKCASKVDVILLLDSSGSLGKKGWDAVKKAGADIVAAMDPDANDGNGAQVAVLAYSGPKDMTAYDKCTGKGSTAVDMVADCKMVWVSHFSTGTKAVSAAIGSMKWLKGSTMTSQALASAEAELVYGRSDAKQVVIVVADRLPMLPRKTDEVAASLRQKAEVIWAVAAGPTELPRFASWASRPVADNIIYMHDIGDVAKNTTINRIIASTCPKVV
jgi:hypothetical protein